MCVTKQPLITGCGTLTPEEDIKSMTFKYRWRETVVCLAQEIAKWQITWPVEIGQ